MADPHLMVVDDAARLARAGADVVADVVHADGHVTIAPATGDTPVGMYADLAERHARGDLDTGGVSIVQLDEYLGLEPGDRRALYGWMDRTVLRPLSIDAGRVSRLPTDGDLDAACAAFDRDLGARGGIDLAILGLGTNGHLGFNEPPSDAASATRTVDLTRDTIEANARYWGSEGDVPTRAVTLGLRTLLDARRILLLVAGASKHAIVRRALEGPVGEDVPASFVREARGSVTVVVDHAAWEGE
ncbi:MAG TPA: glucosamine-6-phosphate deaminase [Actinomycetota bacterium]|nr:glucosamine-6-phosphate deaminase [Actinomycetota bacterium]